MLMPVKPLDPDFPLRSDLARRGIEAVDRDELLLEAEEELARRTQAYPGMVQRRAMTEDQAAHHLATWRAIVDDLRRQANHATREHARVCNCPPARPMLETGAPQCDWETKVRELRAELAVRRNAYPGRIAKPTSPLTADAAARKLERLDALHALYWLGLFAFTGDLMPAADDAAYLAHIAHQERRARLPAWNAAQGDEAERRAQIEASHWRAIDKLARHLLAGGRALDLLHPADGRTIAATLRTARDQADQDWTAQRTAEAEARYVRLARLAAWATTLFPPSAAAPLPAAADTPSERKAA